VVVNNCNIGDAMHHKAPLLSMLQSAFHAEDVSGAGSKRQATDDKNDSLAKQARPDAAQAAQFNQMMEVGQAMIQANQRVDLTMTSVKGDIGKVIEDNAEIKGGVGKVIVDNAEIKGGVGKVIEDNAEIKDGVGKVIVDNAEIKGGVGNLTSFVHGSHAEVTREKQQPVLCHCCFE